MSAVRVITITADELREIIREELRAAQAAPAAAPPSRDGYLSVPAAAKYASVSAETIRDWIASGRLPRRKAGRHYRVSRDDLDRVLSERPSGPQPVDLRDRTVEIIRRARG
ncbi:helix-turn-helix domain-containing protein [Vulgatibacter sp.]|uniref:helix-turn-helix domain-containing protein n=1 Tax=Vulgatibacter sp. TaxID=1971226 RepID=UPI003564AB8C